MTQSASLIGGVIVAEDAMAKIWEKINNPGFKPVEFDGIKKLAGLNSFTLTPKQWIQRTGAIGLVYKAGRYGGTYAQKNIAFEFASWISVEFKLNLIKEFQRLKEEEHKTLGWDIRRNLAKLNYRIHTEAIRDQADSALLVCLSNLENLNALFISEGHSQGKRLRLLNQIAIQQMRILAGDGRLTTLDANKAGDDA